MPDSGHIKAISGLYNGLVGKHGDSLLSVQRPRGRQELVFSVLLDMCEGDDYSILDVGCGVGHLLEFLRHGGHAGAYRGLDVSAEMIRICTGKFEQDGNASFRLGTLDQLEGGEVFDYVVLSGAFNNNPLKLPVEACMGMVTDHLSRMFALCRRGVSVNFASTYVDYQSEGAFHASPEALFSFGKTLTKRVAIRHDYMPYEFTMHLYKDDSISPNRVFRAWDDA